MEVLLIFSWLFRKRLTETISECVLLNSINVIITGVIIIVILVEVISFPQTLPIDLECVVGGWDEIYFLCFAQHWHHRTLLLFLDYFMDEDLFGFLSEDFEKWAIKQPKNHTKCNNGKRR
jgi:hypothetical protein